jgi:hypothetical protein
MKSSVMKRSIVLADYKTSVSLEEAFWPALEEIATGRQTTLFQTWSLRSISRGSKAIDRRPRDFVLDFHRTQLADLSEGHTETRQIVEPSVLARS